MSEKWPIKTVGPTIPSMYLDKRLEDDIDYGLTMFQPETNACIRWPTRLSDLHFHGKLGSITSLGRYQMGQLANGLRQSGKNFLWVFRAEEESKLPMNFRDEVDGHGLIVNWCPQLAVLAHRAVRCFMTHCGWNSTLEAISLGVPLVAMPQWTDQPTNAMHIADVWRVGVRVMVDEKGIVMKDEVEACVRKVMDGDTGREFKENVMKLKDVAKEVMQEGGSSDKNIKEFALKLMSM
ncbi:hypothetical protein vseg_008179 [Gypsophila vaccaria]